MALGAVLGAALALGLPTKLYSLTIGGSETIGRVPMESIEIVEAAPNGVSSMSFSIDDPSRLVNLASGQEIVFTYVTAPSPAFRGYVQSWHVVPDFGQRARSFKVECVGVEILLDWSLIIGPLTIPASTPLSFAIQQLASSATGPLSLNYAAAALSTQATPVSTMDADYSPITPVDLTFTGVTLRSALLSVLGSAVRSGGGGPPGSAVTPITDELFVTVDYLKGLRVWRSTPANIEAPNDYFEVNSIDNIVSSLFVPENIDHQVDAGGVVRTVYVKGGNAAGSGTLSDGTGLPGQAAVIEDATSLTAERWKTIAQAYLNANNGGVRGTFERQDRAFGDHNEVHPGSRLVASFGSIDAAAAYPGAGSVYYRISEVRRTFTAGGTKSNTTFAYGLPRPSGAALIRRLTRNTLS